MHTKNEESTPCVHAYFVTEYFPNTNPEKSGLHIKFTKIRGKHMDLDCSTYDETENARVCDLCTKKKKFPLT